MGRYLVAFASVALSLLVRAVLAPYLGDNVPFLLFYPAILFASWYGGFWPGTLATVLSGAAAYAAFMNRAGTTVLPANEVLQMALFLSIGIAIASLNSRLTAAHTEARREAAIGLGRAERLDAIINTTVDGILVIDSRGVVEEFNRGAERLFGYTAGEVIGRNVNMLMPSPYHEGHDGYMSRYLSTGEKKIIGSGRQVEGRRKDGTVFPLHLSVGEMTIGGDRKFTGMLHDLSARAQLEDQLRASEERWRSVIESAVDGIIVIDSGGLVEAFNPGAERLFGYAAAEVIGRNVNLLMPSPYHEEHDSYLTRYLATGTRKIIGIGREVKGRRKDGSVFPLHLSVGEMTIAGERRFTGMLHDLSDRVTLEEQLRDRTAMAKLGEMAAMIAHEVKNPLAGIRGAVQVIGGRLLAGNPDAPMMQEIVKRIDSLDAMMKDLLLFARPPKPKRAPTDVVPLLSATVGLLKTDEGAKQIDVEIEGSAPPVPADGEMLKMVFHNLLINGAHAMHGQGTIRVRVSTAEHALRVSVSDHGPGIPADVRDKIFTPFFTTKRRGTGLGLPTAKRFVEAHDGRITVECPPAGGTTVTVQLPL